MNSKEKEAMATSRPPPSYESAVSGYPTPSAPPLSNIDTQEPEIVEQQDDEDPDEKYKTRSRLRKEHLNQLLPALVIYAAIPLTMLVIGIINLDKCPMDSQIPIYMIAAGIIALIIPVFPIAINLLPIAEDKSRKSYCLQASYLAFLVGWLGFQIWGSVIVFKKWSYWDSNEELLKDDLVIGCNTTTYLFSFSMLIIYWVLLPVFLYSVTL